MGEHKHKQDRRAVISDLDAAGAVLAGEPIFCEFCGERVPLWPPELLREHCYVAHRAALWPAIADAWTNYKNDADPVRRQNFVNAMRVQFLFTTLQHRADLYAKLVDAGVIATPAQG